MNPYLHILMFCVTITMTNAYWDITGLFDGSWWSKTYDQRKYDAATECGCNDYGSRFPEIFTASKMPVKCVCMISGYGLDEAPGGNDYTTVFNSFEAISISKVDEKQKTLSLSIRLSYMWEDPRINAKSISNDSEINFSAVSPKESINIWQPKRSCHNCDENEIMSFSKIGFVLDNSFQQNTTLVRATLIWKVILNCDFHFSMFPFDHLICEFRLISRGTEKLRDVLYGHENKTMIQVPDNNHGFIANAKIVGINKNDNNSTDQIGFDVVLKRLIDPYLWQYYFPCIATVTISSISFAIPVSAIPGRVSLSVVLILALMNLFTGLMVSK